jgi:uncharacterized protein
MQVAVVMMRRAPQAVVVVALLGVAATAVAAVPSWVPPAPEQMVTDRAGVLSPGVRDGLARSLYAYQQRSGHQVVVWIDRSSGGVPIEQFAVEAFAAWKIGRKGLDDGLAVFAMTEDRAIRIEVGYELESSVTDLVAASVIRNTMIPAIKSGDWDGAIQRGVGTLIDTIEGAPGSLPAADDGGGEGPELDLWWKLGLGLFGLIFLFLLITNPRRALMLLYFIGRSGGGGFGGGGGGGFSGGGGRSGGGGATGHW